MKVAVASVAEKVVQRNPS